MSKNLNTHFIREGMWQTSTRQGVTQQERCSGASGVEGGPATSEGGLAVSPGVKQRPTTGFYNHTPMWFPTQVESSCSWKILITFKQRESESPQTRDNRDILHR